ncbi:protein of unknown function DUF2321 [Syntrophotalea carbinolica DSM 2380]|uniref:DUF2321 domain-containing protein n=1 Tax=Syntrophotalea carbinolica (strain DSM 2380 / NBRC 103641 / GraBd1) TaxID=338963 RepID=Q3A032_SYNC1|nr:DUF2321 domain-containing protein [Syntrophotalea carbinolica]ABA90275.2 protein of unknown function DUF2321 [Syntrophotalea carbinolica DSM 2380]
MSDSYYDVAQICINGHVINSMAKDYPQSNQKYCSDCGEETITACPSCGSNIRGHYHVPGVISFSNFHAPSYCFNCGSPYPWTAIRLEAAAELADELDGLTTDEKEKLKSSLPDLVKDGPKTVVAETRFKKIIKKAGADAYEGMKTILVDVVSETVKKSMFGA